jgi:hypothetical protein
MADARKAARRRLLEKKMYAKRLLAVSAERAAQHFAFRQSPVASRHGLGLAQKLKRYWAVSVRGGAAARARGARPAAVDSLPRRRLRHLGRRRELHQQRPARGGRRGAPPGGGGPFPAPRGRLRVLPPRRRRRRRRVAHGGRVPARKGLERLSTARRAGRSRTPCSERRCGTPCRRCWFLLTARSCRSSPSFGNLPGTRRMIWPSRCRNCSKGKPRMAQKYKRSCAHLQVASN